MAQPPASVSQALSDAERELTNRIPTTAVLQQVEEGGLGLYTRARIGYQAPPDSEDAPRLRLFTQVLSPKWACQIVKEHSQGATDTQLEELIAWALQEEYFRAPGRGLCIHFGGAEFIDFYFPASD
ncbi:MULTISPECIES: hypothetical protein [unclassified Kitasatospora]|uniref:hypothetical protein n=1 Tax=unclassified Kitasatospora TaxID=2633591 RepID=UPI0033D5E3C0